MKKTAEEFEVFADTGETYTVTIKSRCDACGKSLKVSPYEGKLLFNY